MIRAVRRLHISAQRTRGSGRGVLFLFMALPSFVDSTPRAYRLKAGNADLPISTLDGTCPNVTGYHNDNIAKVLIAGFVRTVVLKLMMFAKGAMGLMPALDPVGMIAGDDGGVHDYRMGRSLHDRRRDLGGAFALLEPRLSGGDFWVKGVVLGVGAWLIMVVAMMPMVGAGFFGMQLGMMAPVMMLLMHLVFGAVLGAVCGMLRHRGSPNAT